MIDIIRSPCGDEAVDAPSPEPDADRARHDFSPAGDEVLFEQEYDRKLWRVQKATWNGRQRLQIWPWYQPGDGSAPRPCAARYGGGFPIPLDRVPELIAALSAMQSGEA